MFLRFLHGVIKAIEFALIPKLNKAIPTRPVELVFINTQALHYAFQFPLVLIRVPRTSCGGSFLAHPALQPLHFLVPVKVAQVLTNLKPCGLQHLYEPHAPNEAAAPELRDELKAYDLGC